MSIQLYNTLTARKEDFRPIEPGKVRMYNCGPTVYGPPSIGNYRAFLFADALRRYLEYRGFEVQQVMNITDVGHLLQDREEGEDKLESTARKEGRSPEQIARHYENIFMRDLAELGIQPAHAYPRATEFIPQMISMIEGLIEKGYAYVAGGCVYFDVTRFPDYGKLSKNKLEDLVAGARIEVHPDKRHPADFALWKSDERHLQKWSSPWTEHGFPGWHIECSAMSREYLGESFDIHTGGEDNIFPHHECEIAQSEAFSGKRFVNYWLHTKFLLVEGRKMSKSLGNVYTPAQVCEKGYDMRALRMALTRVHYRQPLNFTWQGMDDVCKQLERMDSIVRRLQEVEKADGGDDPGAILEATSQGFERGMDDDLNISVALAAVHEGIGRLNTLELDRRGAGAALETLRRIDSVLGVMRFGEQGEDGEASAIEALVAERAAAKKERDFQRADRIRDELKGRGIILEDTAQGTRWYRE